MTTLGWSLVIATYKREQSLRRCLELAVTQTRPPREVIVVDGSPDWDRVRAGVMTDIAAAHPHVRWEYVEARVRSLPAQRNQGIGLATSDVLFLIDDDSFMYRDCAEQVMRVYEADPEQRVAGVSPALADASPPDPIHAATSSITNGPATDESSNPPKRSRLDRLKGRLGQFIHIERLLLPYDPDYPRHPLPPALAKMSVRPAHYLHGMRMTYRRAPIQQEGFDEMLQRYASAEDLDASYRVSRHGLLLDCYTALLYHAQDSSARLSRFTRTAMGLVNLAALYHLKSHDPARTLRTFSRRLWQRAGVEMVRDLSRGRLSAPGARANLFALKKIREMRDKREDELRVWLPWFQNQLVERNPSERRSRTARLSNGVVRTRRPPPRAEPVR